MAAKGRKKGETNRDVAHKHALESERVASLTREATLGLATTTWLLGFEKRAINELMEVGYGYREAERLLQMQTEKYFPSPGPCEQAAEQLTKGLAPALQQIVTNLALEIDQLRNMSPSAHRAFVEAMNQPSKRKETSRRDK